VNALFYNLLGVEAEPQGRGTGKCKSEGEETSEWGAIKRARGSRCIKSIMLTGAAA